MLRLNEYSQTFEIETITFVEIIVREYYLHNKILFNAVVMWTRSYTQYNK